MDGLGASVPIIFIAAASLAGASIQLLPPPFGLVGAAVVGAVYIWVSGRIAASVRRLPARMGAEAMRGRRMEVVESLDPEGMVTADGELWRAVEVNGRWVPAGQEVLVVGNRGLSLEVVTREGLLKNS